MTKRLIIAAIVSFTALASCGDGNPCQVFRDCCAEAGSANVCGETDDKFGCESSLESLRVLLLAEQGSIPAACDL